MANRAQAAQPNKLEQSYLMYKKHPTHEKLTMLLDTCMPLIKHFALLYSGGRYELDAVQVGCEGVLKAIKNYDPHRYTSFSTYAGHYIIGEIKHYIRKEMRFYKPQYIEGLKDKAERVMQELYESSGIIPDEKQVANALNIQEEGLRVIMQAGLVSIDELELDKISSIRYESFKLPVEDQIVLFEAIKRLSDIKKKVIYYLFFKECSQQQTADILGMNQRKISRILQTSLSELRQIMIE